MCVVRPTGAAYGHCKYNCIAFTYYGEHSGGRGHIFNSKVWIKPGFHSVSYTGRYSYPNIITIYKVSPKVCLIEKSLYIVPSPFCSVYTSMAIIYGNITESGIIDGVNANALFTDLKYTIHVGSIQGLKYKSVHAIDAVVWRPFTRKRD